MNEEVKRDKKIHATATKDFFVTMITRDITLRDCIFDLLDNSIDGARRPIGNAVIEDLSPYVVAISWEKDRFEIDDNCGGIRLTDAIDYAFHFGRRPDAPQDVRGGIGLYGIGMKRAIFKLGRDCTVSSHASDASFKVIINVSTWEKSDEWDFDYEDIDVKEPKGTNISVSTLNPGVGEVLNDPSFENQFIKDIARDYAFFIAKGLKITVNGTTVPSYQYQLKQSDVLKPHVDSYVDGRVRVRILAGLADELPNDIPDELKPDKVDQYGWFVVCNGRVVLAANKGEDTIWGVDNFNVWHPQYNGFAGYVFFESEDQRELPWTTTKRELDVASPLYRRTVMRMKAVTKAFTDYTNRRKSDLSTARNAEIQSKRIDIHKLKDNQNLMFPDVEKLERPDLININYKRERKEIESVKEYIGNVGMSARDVGIFTFEYYKRVEMGQ